MSGEGTFECVRVQQHSLENESHDDETDLLLILNIIRGIDSNRSGRQRPYGESTSLQRCDYIPLQQRQSPMLLGPFDLLHGRSLTRGVFVVDLARQSDRNETLHGIEDGERSVESTPSSGLMEAWWNDTESARYK